MESGNTKSDVVLMEEWILRRTEREAARQKNASPSYVEFTKLIEDRKLDTTVKKCTGLVRKFKGYTKSLLKPMLKEIQVVNLTKYLSEVADIIAESRFKMTDMPDIIKLCVMLHERYRDFSTLLGENFAKTLRSNDVLTSANVTKVSVSLCLCGELTAIGILGRNQGYSTIYKCVGRIVAADKEGLQCIPISLLFCESLGAELAGLVPKHIRICAEEYNKQLPQSKIVTEEQLELMRNELEKHFAVILKTLTKLHNRTIESEKQNRRLIKYRGEIPADRTQEHNLILQEFENLLSSVTKLSNELDSNLPSFPPLPPDYDEDEKVPGLVKEEESISTADSGIVLYGDEDTRSFYQDFPNLVVYLPPIVYKESVAEAAAEKEKIEKREKAMQYFDIELERARLTVDDDTFGSDLEEDIGEEYEEVKPRPSASFDIYLKGLRNCVTKDMIDSAAYEYVNSHNTKNNCKILTDALVDMPVRRNDLIPLWSRFVAILAPVFPTISLEVCRRLNLNLRRLVWKKNQFHLEIKLKVTRYIGELVKFRVFPKVDVFNCMRILVSSFSHHQIEMACALSETCGKFLYFCYESHQRMKLYLDTMMRKRNAKVLDSRYICLIDNAFCAVCPPEHVPRVAEIKTKIQLFMEYLLQGLTKANLEQTILDFRCLNWANLEVKDCAIKCLSKPQNATFKQVALYASLIAGIGAYQKDLKVFIVDSVLDSLEYGLEPNTAGSNQSRLANIIFVGELYSYKLVRSKVIFAILYKLTCHGVSFDPEQPSELDPPNNLFRARMVCWLLKTCGAFFCGDNHAERLRCFLIYFEYYYWMKRRLSAVMYSENLQLLPYSIVELYAETMEGIRPNEALCTSLEEATERLLTMKAQLAIKYNNEIERFKIEQEKISDPGQDQPNEGLSTISENEECPYLDAEENPDSDHPMSFAGAVRSPQQNMKSNQDSLPALSLEEEEFTREFDKMCMESSGTPSQLPGEFHRVIYEIPIPNRNTTDLSNSGDAGPNFFLLCRKPNKVKDQLTPISIPADSVLFTKLREREKAAQDEKAEVKRLTLKMNHLQLEEEEAIEEAKKKAAVDALVTLPKYRDALKKNRRTSHGSLS